MTGHKWARTAAYSLAAVLGLSAPADAAQAPQALAAIAVGHFKGDGRHFSVSRPWHTLVGSTMICIRRDVPDGQGGRAPTTDYSMVEIAQGRIIAVVKDSSPFGCPNRDYRLLAPISRK